MIAYSQMSRSVKSLDDYGEGYDDEKGDGCDDAVATDQAVVASFVKETIAHAYKPLEREKFSFQLLRGIATNHCIAS